MSVTSVEYCSGVADRPLSPRIEASTSAKLVLPVRADAAAEGAGLDGDTDDEADDADDATDDEDAGCVELRCVLDGARKCAGEPDPLTLALDEPGAGELLAGAPESR
jgi:hypothetical protein